MYDYNLQDACASEEGARTANLRRILERRGFKPTDDVEVIRAALAMGADALGGGLVPAETALACELKTRRCFFTRFDADGAVDCADAIECPTSTVCDALGDFICIAGTCELRGCGDGYREPPGTPLREACEDGNTSDGDACSSACLPTTFAVWSADATESSPAASAPSVAADDAGHLLFVFTEDTGGSRVVRARRFAPSGTALDATPLTLSGDLALGWVAEPSVAAAPGGGWIVVWTDPFADGDAGGIMMRRVFADGSLGSTLVEQAGETMQEVVAA
ncbi:MAG: hypothetical protein ACOC05_09085, partial [Oceanicaulis sp.]